MRLEGMEGVKRRYEEAVDVERMQLDPSSRLDIEIEEINLILKDDIPFESKWAKVLGESNRREFYIINGYKKRVQ